MTNTASTYERYARDAASSAVLETPGTLLEAPVALSARAAPMALARVRLTESAAGSRPPPRCTRARPAAARGLDWRPPIVASRDSRASCARTWQHSKYLSEHPEWPASAHCGARSKAAIDRASPRARRAALRRYWDRRRVRPCRRRPRDNRVARALPTDQARDPARRRRARPESARWLRSRYARAGAGPHIV